MEAWSTSCLFNIEYSLGYQTIIAGQCSFALGNIDYRLVIKMFIVVQVSIELKESWFVLAVASPFQAILNAF